MSTFDICLPVTQPVKFPDLCVVCSKPDPDGTVKLSFLGINSSSFVTMAVDKAMDLDVDPKYYGSNTSNKIDGIPACRGCSAGLKWYHRLLKLGYYTAWIPGLVPIFFLHTPMILNTIFMVLCAVSPGVFTLIFPPSFGASFINGMANFEFKSRAVAEAFLALNEEATFKKEIPASAGQAISSE